MIWIRRMVLWGVVTGAAALLAFGPRPHRQSHGREVTVIDYWEKWGGIEGAQMQEIVDEFNATVGKDKRIFVRYLSVTSVNQKTLVATAAGVPPDIAGMWESNVPQFAALGALEPLDDLAREHGIGPGFYKDVYWEGCHYDGQLYALISTPWVIALHWNKAVFEEAADGLRAAGLDPGRPPQTLEELDAYAQALNTVDESGWVDRAGYVPMHPGWFNMHLPIWFGGTLYDEANRTLTLNTPEALRAFTWLRSYSEILGVKAMTEFRSGLTASASPTDPFITGVVVMEQQGPWRANYFDDLAPHLNAWKMSREEAKTLPLEQRRANYAWGATPFPSAVGEPNVAFAGFDLLTIPRGSRHKREAFEFIAFVNRPEIMERLCSMHSKNSPLQVASEAFLRDHPNPYIDVYETLASSPFTQSVPPVPIWPEVSAELSQVAEKVYLMQQEPQAALDAAQERMQRKLDRFFAIDDKRKRPDPENGSRG